MENQVSSKSIIVNTGIMFGAAGVLVSVVSYAMGAHLDPHWSVQVISVAMLVGFLVFGIKKFKTANGGFLTFGQAVKVGVGISVLAALVSVVYNYIFTSFIEPDFMNQLIEVQNQKWLDQGMTEEQIEASNAMMEGFQNPLLSSAIGIIASAFFGFVVSAITGAILKKSPEEQY